MYIYTYDLRSKVKKLEEDFITLVKRKSTLRMAGKRRGLAVVISVERGRPGSNGDREKLEKLAQNLGFDVRLEVDKTAQEMREMISNIGKGAEQELCTEAEHKSNVWPDDECFDIFVNAHGDTQDGAQFIWDGTEESDEMNYLWILNDIVWPITQCPLLFGKPKLFIINACRGNSRLTADTGPGKHHHNILGDKRRREGEEIQFVKEEADSFLVFSTSDDAVAYRHPEKGTYFVNALVEAFEERQTATHVRDIMTRVNAKLKNTRVGYEGSGDAFGQCSVAVNTLGKVLYL